MQRIEVSNCINNITAVAEELFSEGILSKGVFCEVSSSSMSPLINKGEQVLIRKEAPGKISILDIAVYKHKSDLVMHRVIWRYRKNGSLTYILKGDGMPCMDWPVDENEIVGKIFVIRKKLRLIRLDSFRGKALSFFSFFYSLLKDLLRIYIKEGVRLFVVASKGFLPFNWIYRKYYIFAIKLFTYCFGRFKEVEVIYLRRSMASGKWEAGLSDIDLFVVIDKLPEIKAKNFLKRFWNLYFMMKRFFPFLGEVEICSEAEFNNWLGFAGVRQKESESWITLLKRQAFKREEVSSNPLQFKISCLNEIFSSFWLFTWKLSCVRYSNSVSCTDLHKFANYIYDTIRYTEYLALNSAESIERRDIFIDKFILQNKDIEFTQCLSEFRNLQRLNRRAIPKSLVSDIFCYLIRYLGRSFANLSKQAEIYYSDPSESIYKVIPLSGKTVTESVFDTGKGGSIEGVVSGSHPYANLVLIILKDGLKIDEIRLTFDLAVDCLKDKVPFFLSGSASGCLNLSLFLESPFTYFDITYQGNLDSGSNAGLRFLMPKDDVINLLLKESVGNLNLCFGMFAHNRTPAYLVYHSIANILRTRLALEQKLIVLTLNDAIWYYKKHYPESASELNLFEEKYLFLNIDQLNGLTAREIFYENFGLMRSALESMNGNIEDEN